MIKLFFVRAFLARISFLEALKSFLLKATSRCEAARAEGRGYVSENACFEDTHVQSGTDLVGRRTPNQTSSIVGKSSSESRL